MDHRTFTLQLYNRPARWLPHKHTCSKCGKDHWCPHRHLWSVCLGYAAYLDHGSENDCSPYDSMGWTTAGATAADIAADIASFVNHVKRQASQPFLPMPISVSPGTLHATHDGNGVVTFGAEPQGSIKGQQLDYLFIDDPHEVP